MANTYFQFKQFWIEQDKTAMKVTTDSCLFGAWAASIVAQEIGTDLPGTKRILDIGAGTGLLSLMLAQATQFSTDQNVTAVLTQATYENNSAITNGWVQRTTSIIDAIEIENESALQASANILNSPWNHRIQLINADVRTYLPDYKYRYIVSNPPFYENDLKSGHHAKNIAHHDEGLSIAGLVKSIGDHLADDGNFFLLIPSRRHDEIITLLKGNGLFIGQIENVRSSFEHAPFRSMIFGGRKPYQQGVSTDRSIRDEGGGYTPWFKNLLQPYYLNL